MDTKNKVKDYYNNSLEEICRLGIIVKDRLYAQNIIEIINPNRLKEYLIHNENYILFEDLVKKYAFDSELRNLLLSIIETIEIYFRNKISIFHKVYYGAFAYLKSELFEDKNIHDKFLISLSDSINRNLKDKYNKNFYNKIIVNDQYFPVDIAIDFFSFGMLSKFYSNMRYNDKQNFRKICHFAPNTLKSFLHCTTHIRNLCAHGTRLYNKTFSLVPKFPKQLKLEHLKEYKLWHYIIALYLLYPEKEKWNEDFYDRLIHIIQKYNITLSHIGFPIDYATFFQKEEFIEYLNY